jgi:protein AFG1
VLTDIPHFNADRRNQMRRFITFLDIAYERHVRLLCLAIAAPHELFQAGASTAAATATAAAINPIRSAEKGASVAPAGGSSGRSTTMIGTTEWSATGLAGASLADIDPTKIEDEMFAFERAVSRLNEMSSTSYVEQWVSLHTKE